jgi:hypothetical protein
MTGQQIYHVRRFVSGATGTNTINIYHVPAIHAEWDPGEEYSVAGEIEMTAEEHLVEGGIDIKVENYDVVGQTHTLEPIEPVLTAVTSIKSEPELQAHAEIEEAAPQSEDEIDAKTMAAAMKDAARQGIPFCEECTKARLRLEKQSAPKAASAARDTRINDDIDAKAMAAAMKDAARQGIPFCEECTKARLRQERSMAPQ